MYYNVWRIVQGSMQIIQKLLYHFRDALALRLPPSLATSQSSIRSQFPKHRIHAHGSDGCIWFTGAHSEWVFHSDLHPEISTPKKFLKSTPDPIQTWNDMSVLFRCQNETAPIWCMPRAQDNKKIPETWTFGPFWTRCVVAASQMCLANTHVKFNTHQGWSAQSAIV